MALRRGFFRRFLHRPVSAKLPEFLSLPVGEPLREKLSALDSHKPENLRGVRSSDTGTQLSGPRCTTELMTRRAPPLPLWPQGQVPVAGNSLSVSEMKKILKLYQVEKLKARLREIPESCVSRTEFLKICAEGGGDNEQVSELARSLDDSGTVIVFGDVVFLRPQQMAKSMEALINQTRPLPDDPRRTELAQLERTKAIIDQEAQNGVRAELRFGMGLLAAQTLGFMRLTFWELSWDVMEPICFFVTSLHFILGYAFFLRTSTEPSFEGFTKRRFRIRQKKLMEIHGFNVGRYNELKMLFYQPSSSFRC